MVGLTGVEPVTLRLSSACSNQLSYTPAFALARSGAAGPKGVRRKAPSNPNSTGDRPLTALTVLVKAGGAEETRTPDL